MRTAAFRDLEAAARRFSRRPDEVDDLVQEALLEAVRSGRDLDSVADRRWMTGVIRNKARLSARTGARRRIREQRWSGFADDTVRPVDRLERAVVLAELSPSLRIVAALVLSGHSRREIAYLLRLPETALRQRISALRKHMRRLGIPLPGQTPGLHLDLAYGRIRDALLPLLLSRGGAFASHDPDGHLIVFSTKSRSAAHDSAPGGN